MARFKFIFKSGTTAEIIAASMDMAKVCINMADVDSCYEMDKEMQSISHAPRPDEPTFTLRAQDETAAEVVLYWVARNVNTISEEKRKRALSIANEMANYPHDKKRKPD